MKRLIAIVVLLFVGMPSAYSQNYSTLPPSVVGQPAVAIHAGRGNAPQVYQYADPVTPLQFQSVPPTSFTYDMGSGKSTLQHNMSGGFTIIQPLNSNNDDDDDDDDDD